MARYTDHDELAAEALSICAALRDLGPVRTYHHLAYACQRDSERMAQLLMCLAAWVDFDGPASALVQRAEAIVETRAQAAEARAAT